MAIVGFIALIVLFAVGAAAGLWYLRARVQLANNPKLIEAGAGAVKGAVFLRIYRHCRTARGLDETEATHLAAAAVSALYGDVPEGPHAVVCLEDRPDDVEEELRDLATQDAELRCLVTDALTYRTRLPARPPYDPDKARESLDRAQELGITIPTRRSTALWSFVRKAVQFLKDENHRSQDA
ncbi:hypothetical protein HQ560_22190 [bacterium]|nr:hypothetical protein [bacterium]